MNQNVSNIIKIDHNESKYDTKYHKICMLNNLVELQHLHFVILRSQLISDHADLANSEF